MDLSNRAIAVLGGDEREREIARLAAETGATVRGYGFPWPETGIPGVTHSDGAAAAMDGADYALFPIPGIGGTGALFAPEQAEPIVPDATLLGKMRPGASIILGAADERLNAAATATGITLREYEHDTELMLLRAPAIVEGALRVMIENTDVTVHSAEVGVVGFGNIGRALARTLTVLGARVHVFARNPVQRADAYVIGCVPHPLTELTEQVSNLAVLCSTAPAAVVGPDIIARMRPGLVVDLAAPPGGVDLAAAERAGHRAVWARGLGRRAPVTVGRSQWHGIASRIAAIEERSAV